MKPASRVRVIKGLEEGYPYPYPPHTRGHTRTGSPTPGEHYSSQYLSPFETTDALTVVVSNAVKLLLALPNFPLEAFQCIHRASEMRHFGEERFVAYVFKHVVDLMPLRVVAEEVATLLVRVLGGVAMVEVRGSVDVT